MWRKRRLIAAESAKISEKVELTGVDFVTGRFAEARDRSRDAIASGGLLKHVDNPLAKTLNTIDERRMEYRSAAAIIPDPGVSDHLMRYETHLSREIDRTLNRLERLQRARKGQPPAPRVEVEIS
jgi:hypothetical protein